MSNFIIDPQRGPHIRDYSDQSQDRVIICSNTGYWAANGCGYTTSQMAGVYTRDDAYKRAGHCGPEKGCCFYDVPADHVPTLQAEVERLRADIEKINDCLCVTSPSGIAQGVLDAFAIINTALAAQPRKKEGA